MRSHKFVPLKSKTFPSDVVNWARHYFDSFSYVENSQWEPDLLIIFTFLGSDLVSGDGIYSRYLTQYHGAGRYSFDISVHDNYHQAFTIRPSRSDEKSKKVECCGSTIDVPLEDQIPTGAFIRKAKGPVLHLLQVPPYDVDLLPPAPIKDLK